MSGAGGKCDPSRGAARGTRVGGRGGRGGLRRCADGAPGRRGPTGGGRPFDRASSSRRVRGRTTRTRRTTGGTRGRSSGGAADTQRRSLQGDLRLDNEPRPCHKGTGCLGLSELGAVTRVRWPRPDPHPTTWSTGRLHGLFRRGRRDVRSGARRTSGYRSVAGDFRPAFAPLHGRHAHLPRPAKGAGPVGKHHVRTCRVPHVPSGTEVLYSAGSPA